MSPSNDSKSGGNAREEESPVYERVQDIPVEVREHISESNILLLAVSSYLNIPREEMWMNRETLMLDWDDQEDHLRKLKAGGTLEILTRNAIHLNSEKNPRHPCLEPLDPDLASSILSSIQAMVPRSQDWRPLETLLEADPVETIFNGQYEIVTIKVNFVEPLKELLVSDVEQLFTGTLEDLVKMMLRAAGVISRKSTGWRDYCKDWEMHIERFGELTNKRAKTALEELFRIKDSGFPADVSELNVNTVTCLEFLDEQIAMCKKIEETFNNLNSPWRLDPLVHLNKVRREYDEKHGSGAWYLDRKWGKLSDM